jgi:hypothetical protein
MDEALAIRVPEEPMRYVFAATPEEESDAFFERLQQARDDPADVARLIKLALVHLIGIRDRQQRTGSLTAAQLSEFRRKVETALSEFKEEIAVYLHLAIILAEGANTDEWYELCLRRSVIQLLLDDYGATPLTELLDPVDVEDLDAEMRRLGLEWGRLPAKYVPQGLPASHWWWHYPGPGS